MDYPKYCLKIFKKKKNIEIYLILGKAIYPTCVQKKFV